VNEPRTEQQKIDDAQRLNAFLGDEVVARALRDLEQTYFDEFRRPNLKPEDVQHLHAKVCALQDFLTRLKIVQDDGKVAAAQREQREAAEARAKAAADRNRPRR
jgi:hypothetical protein